MEAIWEEDQQDAYVVPAKQMDEFAEAMFRAGLDAAIEVLEDFTNEATIDEIIEALKLLDFEVKAG